MDYEFAFLILFVMLWMIIQKLDKKEDKREYEDAHYFKDDESR